MAEASTDAPEAEEKKVPLADVEARLQGKEPEERKQEEPEEKKDPPKSPPPKPKEPELSDEDKEAIGKADNPDSVKNAILKHQTTAREERERREALEAEVQKYKDAEKTEQERLQDRAERAETERDTLKSELQRFKVATQFQLPSALAERLRGDSEEELAADAKRLLELVKPSTPTGDPDAGKGRGTEDDSGDMNKVLRKKAGIST